MAQKLAQARKCLSRNWAVILSQLICIVIIILGVILRGNAKNFFVAAIAFFLILVPILMSLIWKFLFPRTIHIFYIFFVVACLIGGEIFRLYDSLRWYDKSLHLISGAGLAVIGFSIGYGLNLNKKQNNRPSPILMTSFAFFFALGIGMLWEFFEFIIDNIFGSNMLRWQDTSQSKFGAGLHDIIWDMLFGFFGALTACSFCWLWLHKHPDRRLFAIRRKTQEEKP